MLPPPAEKLQNFFGVFLQFHIGVDSIFQSPKSGKPRTITPAPAVMAALKKQRARQSEMQLKAGPIWDNPHGLVFTGEAGRPMSHSGTDKRFRALCAAAGLEGVRFHDCRHPNVKPETKSFSTFLKFSKAELYALTWGVF